MLNDNSVVLGVNAWAPDAAAATLDESGLLSATAEERLSAIKHDRAYPERSIHWLTQPSPGGNAHIAAIAFPFNPDRFSRLPAGSPFTVSLSGHRDRTLYRIDQLRKMFPGAPISCIDHHLAHAAYALSAAPIADALIVALDSVGEVEAGAAFVTTDSESHPLRRVWTLPMSGSLGAFYAAITRHLGFKANDEEGSVMALAAKGNKDRYLEAIQDVVQCSHTEITLNPTLLGLNSPDDRRLHFTKRLIDRTVERRRSTEVITLAHADLAASAQYVLEQTLTALIGHLVSFTGKTNIVLCGGIALNCVANACVAEALPYCRVFVPPAPGDDGSAAGAAIVVGRNYSATLNESRGSAFLGPHLYGDTVRLSDVGFRPVAKSDPYGWAAEQLAGGDVVGLVEGAAEFGPRALGHRSILANAGQRGITDLLNSRIKHRETFRPFAPAVATHRAEEWFGDFFGRVDGGYMSFAAMATDAFAEEFPEVVHDNGRARAQLVSRETAPELSTVLTRMEELGQQPLVINTSLNVKGQAIVNRMNELIRFAEVSGVSKFVVDGVGYAR